MKQILSKWFSKKAFHAGQVRADTASRLVDPRDISKPWTDDGPQTFYFIHIPKTAGTSVRRMLSGVFAQEEIYPNRQTIVEHRGYPSTPVCCALTSEEKQRIRLFMGHYSFGMYRLFGDNVHKLVFLREPVARAISNLYHFKNRKPVYRDFSLEELYTQAKSEISNLQSRTLAMDYVAQPPDNFKPIPQPIDNALEAAKKNLEACEFVGITERLSESIDLLNRQYGFNIRRMPKLNPARKQHTISPKLLTQIQEDSAQDIQFYEFALQLFEKRLKEQE